MSEYLLPNNHELTIDSQRNLFAIRNRMVNIPSNFSSKQNNLSKCFCGETEDMEHIYYCKYINSEETEGKYENLFCGNMNEQKIVFRRFEQNLENRKEYSNIKICDNEEGKPDQVIHDSDPLFSVSLEYAW